MKPFTDLLKTLLAPALLALALTVPAGCRKESGPTAENVPASADYLLVVDLAKLADGAEAAAILPDTWADMARLAEQTGAAADFSKTLVYKVVGARYPFAAVRITDKATFTDALARQDWVRRKVEGSEVYQPAEASLIAPCVIVDGEGAWYLASATDVKAWRESLKEAEKECFARFMPDEAEAGDIVLSGAANPAAFGLGGGKEMIRITGSLALDKGTLTVDAIPVDASTGEPVAFDALAPIDNADASADGALPQGTPSLTVAAGIPKGIDWSGLIELCGPGLGTRNQGMLQSLLPYFASLDGTLVLCAGPLDAQSLETDDIERQHLLLSARLEGSRSVDAVEEINGNLRDKGLSPRPRPDGVYAFSLDGVAYRYTARDGRFIFALNREIDAPADHAAPVAADSNLRLSARLTLPALRSLVPDADADSSPAAELKVDNAGAHLQLRARPQSNPLAVIGSYLKALDDHSKKIREESADYYDYYD